MYPWCMSSCFQVRYADRFVVILVEQVGVPFDGYYRSLIGLYWLVGTPDYLGLGILGNRPDAITLPAMSFDAAQMPKGTPIAMAITTDTPQR